MKDTQQKYNDWKEKKIELLDIQGTSITTLPVEELSKMKNLRAIICTEKMIEKYKEVFQQHNIAVRTQFEEKLKP